MRAMGCLVFQGYEACPPACQHRTVPQPPEIDRYSEVYPYAQIARHLAAEIRSGERAPGSELPSIVTLVQEWAVNRKTAQKALRLLGDQGLARLSQGMGWYVAERLPD